MHVFLAGASGAVGQALIPQLLERGHTVTGTTSSRERADGLDAAGATPVVVDGLNRDAVVAAVVAAEPEAIVHQMTALRGVDDVRRFAKTFAMTNRLRTEGTDYLLEAARAAGVERVVAQSFTGWPFAPEGGPVKDETAPLRSAPPRQLRTTLAAIRHVERVVPAAEGVVLRYGGLYGPGTGLVPGGEQWEAIRQRRFPIVGSGDGVWSFTHIEDAASATVAVLERWTPGEIFHVVDSDPAPIRDWLPELAAVVGGPPPRKIPHAVVRLIAPHLEVLMCTTRGASNAKIRDRLGWAPAHGSWRTGFSGLRALELP